MFATLVKCKLNFGKSITLNIFKRCIIHKRIRHPGMPINFEPKTPSIEKNLKRITIPEGYELIYCNRSMTVNNFGQCIVVVGISLATYIIGYYFYDSEGLTKKHRLEVSALLIGLLIGGFALVAHLLITRQPQFIYIKNKEYITVMNGILGPLKRKYIQHTASDVVPIGQNIFFFLKNRFVVIFPDYFLNMNDYWNLCIHDEKNTEKHDDTSSKKIIKKDN